MAVSVLRHGDTGIVYLATRPRFVAEAIASAESARQHTTSTPICLYTDAPELLGSSTFPFDSVVRIPRDGPPAKAFTGMDARDTFLLGWGYGLGQKIDALIDSPFRRTLYLDSDTRVLRPEIVEVFGYLDEYEMALTCCTAQNSRTCRLHGPMFGCGVMAVRNEASTLGLLQRWRDVHRVNMELATRAARGTSSFAPHLTHEERVFVLANDQTSLASILSPERNDLGIAVKVLDDVWNARSYRRDMLHGVVIDHSELHKIGPTQAHMFLRARAQSMKADAVDESSQRNAPTRDTAAVQQKPR